MAGSGRPKSTDWGEPAPAEASPSISTPRHPRLWVAFSATLAMMRQTQCRPARAQGKRLGRPRASQVLLSAAAELARSGVPVARAARLKGVKATTLRRFIATE
jgi:hypothetical protein